MVRYGIAGFGLHAVKRLMPGFGQATNSTVVALSRRDQQKACADAQRYGIPHVFDSTATLCECPEVDAVFVTTPNALHIADVLTAAEAGKHILCEKPMAMNADEARRMIDAARANGVLLGVAQCFRFEPSVHRLRDLIAANTIGAPVFARFEFSYLGIGHARTWIYDAKLAGSGPIGDVGVHCIDTARVILADEPVSVQVTAHSDKASGEVEAAAVLVLEFSRGTLVTILVSTRSAYRTPIEIVGTTGTLRADDGLNVEYPITIELLREGKLEASETVMNVGTYGRQVDAFSAAVEGRAAFPVPGEEGWRNQVILDAALKSVRTGKREEIRF